MTTKRWIGNAAAVTDLWTINLSGTVINQTYTMTINAKAVTYTAGGADSAAVILAALVAAWNASTIPEFAELSAAGVGAVGAFTGMTVTQDVSGRPTTITVATGGGATFGITHTTSATGPNFFDNAQNWSGGVAPVNSDYLVWDNGGVACLYNINTSLTGLTIDVEPGYSGTIGLPLINATGKTTYNEYRTTSLTLGDNSTTYINGPSVRRCNLALSGTGSQTTVTIVATGTRIDQYTPVILLTGGYGSTLNLTKGDVGVAFYLGTAAYFLHYNVGYVSNPNTDATLWIGAGATTNSNIIKNGGNVTVNTNCVVAMQDIAGGTLTIAGSATVTSLTAYSGVVNLNTTGTIGSVNLYGSAILTADGDPRAKTLSNPINVYSTAVTVTDNAKTINSGVLSLGPSGLTSVNVNHGGNTSIVYS